MLPERVASQPDESETLGRLGARPGKDGFEHTTTAHESRPAVLCSGCAQSLDDPERSRCRLIFSLVHLDLR